MGIKEFDISGTKTFVFFLFGGGGGGGGSGGGGWGGGVHVFTMSSSV